jgi:hypothetical protein
VEKSRKQRFDTLFKNLQIGLMAAIYAILRIKNKRPRVLRHTGSNFQAVEDE